MDVAPARVEVGVRELKNNLSRYLELVRKGDELVVTDRGRPVARLLPVDASTDHLSDLVAAGLVRAPKARRRVPELVEPTGSVSELVAEQRR